MAVWTKMDSYSSCFVKVQHWRMAWLLSCVWCHCKVVL